MAAKAKAKTQPVKKEKKDVVKKKKLRLTSPKVKVIVNSSYNNTLIAVTDYNGAVISSGSAGIVGFKGSRKSTAYAATKAGEVAASKAVKLGAQEAWVIVKGIGEGRQAAVKGIRIGGLRISLLSDHTPVPHGGVKPRKQPRK